MTWVIDASHSVITFSVRHMMISKVRGRFTRFDGTVDFDEQNPTNSKFRSRLMPAASILVTNGVTGI